jgi:hypothetical protein
MKLTAIATERLKPSRQSKHQTTTTIRITLLNAYVTLAGIRWRILGPRHARGQSAVA